MEQKDIKTTVQLAAAFPELVAQLREEAVKGVDLSAARKDGAATERERILGLVAIQFGEESGSKFKTIVETGVSVEAFKAIRAMNPEASASASEEDKKKKELLAAIQAAGPDNPGGGKADTASGKDFLTLVDEHVQIHKCKRTEAMQAVIKAHPDKHHEYLQKVQLRQVK